MERKIKLFERNSRYDLIRDVTKWIESEFRGEWIDGDRALLIEIVQTS